MKNLTVDNEHLNNLAKWMEKFIEDLKKDIAYLKDEKGDIFNRYMSYNRCRVLHDIIKPIQKSMTSSMISGHNLQNKIFHTEEGKKNGWDECKPGEHPFFEHECNHDHDNDNDNEIPETLKKIIDAVILQSIIGKRKKDDKAN